MPFTPSNNSMEPPPLRFGDLRPIPASCGLCLPRSILELAGRLISRPLGRPSVRLSAVGRL